MNLERENYFMEVDSVNLLVLLEEYKHLDFFCQRLVECQLKDILILFIHRSREAFNMEMLKYRGPLETLKFYLGDLIYGAEEVLLKQNCNSEDVANSNSSTSTFNSPSVCNTLHQVSVRKQQSNSLVWRLLEALGKEKILKVLMQNNTDAARNIRKYREKYQKREAARLSDQRRLKQRETLLRKGRTEEEFEELRKIYIPERRMKTEEETRREPKKEEVRKVSTRYKMNQESQKILFMSSTPRVSTELDFTSSNNLVRANSKFDSRNSQFEERHPRLSDFEKHFVDFAGKTQYTQNGSYPNHMMELSRSVVNGTRYEESRETAMYITTTEAKEKREVKKIIAERHYKAHQRQKAAALLRAKMLNESAVVRNLVVTNTSHNEISRPHSKSTSNRELWLSRFKDDRVQICSPFFQREQSREKERPGQAKIAKIPKRKLMSLVKTKAVTQLGELPKEGTGILMIKKLESMKPTEPKPSKRFMMTHRKQLRVVSMPMKNESECFREHTSEY